MDFVRSKRLGALPPYLFGEIDRRKRAALAAGRDVINFGIGDPDQPTPKFIIDRLEEAARHAPNHQYPQNKGSARFREAAANWFKRRFDVDLDPDREVLMLIGSKEGLGHIPLATLNPGDGALIPSPGYPVYHSACIFAGGIPHEMPLKASNGWLPDFDAIPPDHAQAAKLMYLNYPNNPTSAVADLDFFERALAFARRHDILIVQDAAYSEITFERPSPSILQLPGGKESAVELYSLSKTFNMTGWRIGFAVGHAEVLAALADVKENLDSGQFTAVQEAAVEALDNADHIEVRALVDLYRERRDVLVDGLNRIGFDVAKPEATFYVWMPVPRGYDSMTFAAKLLDEADVVAIPGVGFGQAGENHVRFALTVPTDRIRQALERLGKLSF
ncbi:MAG: LL-diaminopimelate aminotransferase [Planctomycetes bacterium]|nr:LL-diaminopimelate aminotransferase [Planctomycetota bacterium]